ncbi:MAG: HEAT repeat domain-containing protein [Bacteroidota bacterium]
MTEEEIIALWQEQVAGEITDEDQEKLNQALEAHPEYAVELQNLKKTWNLFQEIETPEPSPRMDEKFEDFLSSQRAKRPVPPHFWDALIAAIQGGWRVGISSLIIGVLVGWWFIPAENESSDLQYLSEEVAELKEMMMLTLIQQPQAQERIKAVNMAGELPKADIDVINALITTLNQDKNLNVRLAALESLIKYDESPKVRSALIDALEIQESPLILVAIADALVQFQEKGSIEALEKKRDEISSGILKDKLASTIQKIRQS